MSGERIEFVDSISASANLRLSLTSGAFSVLQNGTSCPPPQLRRVTVDTMLGDGALIPASAFSNRVLTLHIQLRSDNAADLASAWQLLNRELDRPYSILRWQPSSELPPVYFRTFRAPDYGQEVDHGLNLLDVTVAIEAEPFAYGEVVTSDTILVRNDPADPDNPKYFDVNNIAGDVETPLIITVGDVMWYHQTLFAVRRGGNPNLKPHVLQAEVTALGTNTTLGANNSAYSGSGQNNAVTTFGSSNNLTVSRLGVNPFPVTASPDVRGTYRVFARVNATVANTSFVFRLWHGQRNISNDSNTYTITNLTRPVMVDLGLVQLPEGFDPIGIGPSGELLSVAGGNFGFSAQRTSGSGNLIWDYVIFVPADDHLCIVNWGTVLTDKYVMDGYQRAVYGLNAAGEVQDIGAAYFTGDMPMVSPGVANRITYINDVSPNPGADDLVSWYAEVTYRYYPRYLYVRPVNS